MCMCDTGLPIVSFSRRLLKTVERANFRMRLKWNVSQVSIPPPPPFVALCHAFRRYVLLVLAIYAHDDNTLVCSRYHHTHTHVRTGYILCRLIIGTRNTWKWFGTLMLYPTSFLRATSITCRVFLPGNIFVCEKKKMFA